MEAQCVRGDGSQVEVLRIEGKLLHVEASEFEEVVDQSLHALGALGNGAGRLRF